MMVPADSSPEENASAAGSTVGPGNGRGAILGVLRGADRALLRRLTRRMINHLSWSGIERAEDLLGRASQPEDEGEGGDGELNRPQERAALEDLDALAESTFQLAAVHLPEDELVRLLQAWIKEDKAGFLYSAVEHLDIPLTEVASAIDRFHGLRVDEAELPHAMVRGLRVNLIRRFISDQLAYINTAKDVTRVADFHDLVHHMVFTPDSRGKLGGKSAGLFLASRVVRAAEEQRELLGGLRVPKTWYLPSDGLLEFLRYNDMGDVYDRKYRDIDLIRQDYPYLVQAFKAAQFPPEMARGLSAALDDFEQRPIIVRSSSLLEDRVGAAFAGKYKSLFLGNQGTKRQRLAALQDAIAEVYASVFGPDPIEYRAERGLLDVHEEMGIMIQEVVGQRLGPYFLPAFSGLAYGSNEFPWSSRIRREDGLVRMVPGLGTRAVDRLSDDYPVLVAPGQPGLRVNQTPDEIVRYSPRKIDVINLETNAFETVLIRHLLRSHGSRYPMIRHLVVEVDEDDAHRPVGRTFDFRTRDCAVTFEGLINDTPFIAQIRTLLNLLQERLGGPVDLEFASDGDALYLLQCRPQGYGPETAPARIPRDVPRDRILFTATRHVSNGRVPNITHIVYVDGAGYAALPGASEMREVGVVVGRLNRLLPKRQFVLMGPGRWGSRGDITLGVPVTYSQISNTAMLIEIARQKGNYVPDLSFGTHFFQDLVETGIRYLPLYPDDPQVIFNETFFHQAHNMLPELLPDAADFADTVRVIDVSRETDGKVVRILMNAELDEAVGLICDPAVRSEGRHAEHLRMVELGCGDHARWRLRMAEQIAAAVDPERFGVHAMYVVGDVKNATSGPGSDLDLIVHFVGNADQRLALEAWLEGWSLSLAEVNYLRTGQKTAGLLDVRFVSDQDVAAGRGCAAKIDAATDPARPLQLGHPRGAKSTGA